MISQTEITFSQRKRGAHLITNEIFSQLHDLPSKGILHLFICHTSAALTINENADPDVRHDITEILNRLIKENEPYFLHTLEGSDDMPAHAKSSIIGQSLTIPIKNGQPNMGTWQGIYLMEFRNYGRQRKIIATIIGE